MSLESISAESDATPDADNVLAESVITVPGVTEFVVVQRTTVDELEVYQRTEDEDLPFAQIAPKFRVEAEWPEPPEHIDVDILEGTVTVEDTNV